MKKFREAANGISGPHPLHSYLLLTLLPASVFLLFIYFIYFSTAAIIKCTKKRRAKNVENYVLVLREALVSIGLVLCHFFSNISDFFLQKQTIYLSFLKNIFFSGASKYLA